MEQNNIRPRDGPAERSMEMKRIFRYYLAVIIAACIFITLFPQGVVAVSFNSFSGAVGTIGNGNGYFDNEDVQFNFTGERNIYTVTELSGIYLVEPLGYPLGVGAVNIIYRGDSDLRFGMVASDGYLYYVDASGIKKKITRASTGPVYANDTDIGEGSLLVYGSANILTLAQGDNKLYFTDGFVLKSISLDGALLITTEYTFTKLCGDVTQNNILGQSIAYSDGNVYIRSICVAGAGYSQGLIRYNGTVLVISGNDNVYTTTASASMFVTQNYIFDNYYINVVSSANEETTYYKSNLTIKYSNWYTAPNSYGNIIKKSGGQTFLGGKSTVALFSASSTAYNVFNFVEPGLLITPTIPPELTYNIASIKSVYPTYYNNSIIKLKVDMELTITEQQYDDNNYAHRVDIDNSTSGLNMANTNIIIPCTSSGFWPFTVTYNCILHQEYQYASSTTWASGNYIAKLYEINTSIGDEALLDSDTFTILNQSGQLVNDIPVDNSEGTPTSESIVGLLQTNIFWALILIVGLMLGLGALAGKNGYNPIMPMLMGGMLGLAVMTFLGWVPLWIVIAIVLVLIVSFAWTQAQQMGPSGGK